MTEAEPVVLLEKTPEGVAILTLNRPDKHNALSNVLMDEMSDHLLSIRDDPEVRVVVVTGAGEKAFCAGRDMNEGVSDGRASRVERPSPMTLLVEMDKPTIAAVNGYAFGGGALLSLMCDLRYAAGSATFRFPGAAYGLAVGAGLLAQLIGPSRAKDLIFTTRVVKADEALSLGLVNQVVDIDVKEYALGVAASIAKHSVGALATSKRLIDDTVRPTDLMKLEGAANGALRTDEQSERFKAAASAVTGRQF
ncbi:MAG: enoyl-CoA hydratase/isomerase family protein [Dehalococcoidia bacterium]